MIQRGEVKDKKVTKRKSKILKKNNENSETLNWGERRKGEMDTAEETDQE